MLIIHFNAQRSAQRQTNEQEGKQEPATIKTKIK